MSTDQPHRKVMISSTSLDLPEHRKKVIDACLRMDCIPLAMETLGAADATAARESLRLVDEADLYIGIFAHRYGFVPPGHDQSITELEYEHALQRGIPILIFFMHDDHPLTAKDVEKGTGADKLQKLKDRITVAYVAAFFKSVDDLRAHVIQALAQSRDLGNPGGRLHYVSDIPEPPEPYIAHPYVLLQSRQLVGRREELNLLTDWVAKRDSTPYCSRLFHLVAIGGQGKSALTWHWFQNVAEQEMQPLTGRMWWSFYESDASFENLVTRALAYVTRKKIEEVRQIPLPDREAMLLATLDRTPYLIVLDGFERLLLAYSGENVRRLQDDTLDAHNANFVAAASGLPASAAQSFTGQHRLRLTSDPRVGAFLKRLTHVRASRILISTRLYPADLQTSARGEPVASCFAYFLPGLTDDDALSLWRALGARGSREAMLPLLTSFDKHPLLVQALASVVSHDRRAIGDFDVWRKLHSDFDPFPLLHSDERRSHVLSYALRGIDERQLRLLQTIAGFRMPTTYETLVALFVAPELGNTANVPLKPAYSSEPEFDAALSELEDRGLLGWDRRANRYDLHPIVRGVVMSNLDQEHRRQVFTMVHDHFASIATPSWESVGNIDDLAPAIELFHTLIELERYQDAYEVFGDRLSQATLWRFNAGRLRIELVERLFPEGTDQPPRLSLPLDQANALGDLALAYDASGEPGASVPIYLRSLMLDKQEKAATRLSVTLSNLSDSQRLSGDIRGAEASAREALWITRRQADRFQESVALYRLGLALAVRGASPVGSDLASARSKEALDRSMRLTQKSQPQGEGLLSAYFAEVALWHHDLDTALARANRAWDCASALSFEADFIRAARLQGTASARLFEDRHSASIEHAHERLHHALTRARTCELVEQELPTLIAMAEVHSHLGDLAEARRLLDDVWDRAERGPYPLFYVDALNMLARIERATAALAVLGSKEAEKALAAAKKAALAAFEKAWLQGPPFGYAFGLYHALKHLTELGAPFPDLPPYDDSKYEPMPEVEIDPPELAE